MMVAIDRATGAMMEKQAALAVAYINEYWMNAMAGKEMPRAKTEEFTKHLAASFQG